MPRVLSAKEQGVADRFARFGLETVDANPISFTSKGTMFNIKDPVVMRVGDTGALLVFGDLQKSMGLEELRAWLEERMRMESEGKRGEEGADGEGHACTGPCGHTEEERDGEAGAQAEAPVAGEDERVSEDDVRLIMGQVSAPREKVIETLRECDYDVVNALIQLTKNE